MQDCKTRVRLPDGDRGSRLIVELAPTVGPYAVITPADRAARRAAQEMVSLGGAADTATHDIGSNLPLSLLSSAVATATSSSSRTRVDSIVYADDLSPSSAALSALQQPISACQSPWVFEIYVPEGYPFEPPSVRCVVPATLYHPLCVPLYPAGIREDDNGKPYREQVHSSVLLPLLLDWAPTRRLADVISWLQGMLLSPDADLAEAPNSEAADVLRTNPSLFQARVLHCGATTRPGHDNGASRRSDAVTGSKRDGYHRQQVTYDRASSRAYMDEFGVSNQKRLRSSDSHDEVDNGEDRHCEDDEMPASAAGDDDDYMVPCDASSSSAMQTPIDTTDNPRKKVRVFRDRMTNSVGRAASRTSTLVDNIQMVNAGTGLHQPGSRSWKVRRVVLSPDISQDVTGSSGLRLDSNGSPALRALKMSLKVPVRHISTGAASQSVTSSSEVDGQSLKKRARF